MISIIVPVYNVESYLTATIESILQQTYNNFEVILVDDGSTDSSGAICDQWVLKDSRISVIHKNNGGLSSSRNVGLELAKGDYIAFIDSDDLIEDSMLDEMASILDQDNKIGIVSCSISTFINDSDKLKTFLNTGPSDMYSFYDYYRLILQHKKDNSVCNKLYRKEIIGKSRFAEGKINEDILFNVELLLQNIDNKIFYLSKPFYHYRLRSGSITRQANPKAYDFILNAFEIKDITQRLLGNALDIELQGYIGYEMVNFISTIGKYNGKSSFLDEITSCKNYLTSDLLSNIINKNWPFETKIKAVLVIFFPAFYRFLLNFIH